MTKGKFELRRNNCNQNNSVMIFDIIIQLEYLKQKIFMKELRNVKLNTNYKALS